MLTVKSDVLKGLMLFAGKNDVRYYLNSLQVEVSGNQAVLVATNGYMLGAYRLDVPETAHVSFIIPRESVEQAIKLASKGGDIVIFANRLHSGGADLPFTPIDGSYPDWKHLFEVMEKGGTSGEIACYDHKYMEVLGKAAKLITSKYASVRIAHNGKSSALVQTPDPDFIGIIMPMKSDCEHYNLVPAWTLTSRPVEAIPDNVVSIAA